MQNFKKGILAMCIASSVAAFAAEPLFTQSVTRSEDPNFWWNVRRAEKQKEIKSKAGIRVAFYGDSITQEWEDELHGLAIWNEYFENDPYKAVQLGYGGDSTHHLLYRLDNGEMDGMEPEVIVLQIGTNNAWNQPEYPPCDTVLGIRKIVDKLKARFYISKIILCAIPPCGEKPDDPRRIKNDVVNAEIQKMCDYHTVFWCDWGKSLVNEEGILDLRVMPDGVHPGKLGFKMWFEALKPFLDEFLYLKGTPETLAAQTKSEQGWWMQRMLERRSQIFAKEDHCFDLVLAGDSITHFWESTGKEAYEKHLSDYSCLNLGYGGDWTQNLLWRFRNGELDGYEAKAVNILIGTNNHKNTANEVADAIKEIVKLAREKQPKATIILMPILPCEERPDNPVRIKNEKTNELIKSLADGKKIVWLDIRKELMNEDGTLSKDVFPDYLHPSAAGYEVWAKALKPCMEKFAGKAGK